MAKIPRHIIAASLAQRSLGSIDGPRFAEEIAAYLLSQHRTAELESLLRDIMQYRADHGIVEVIAVSAYPLTAESRNDIEQRIQALYPEAKRIIITAEHNADVVGGVQLQLANQQLDLSVRAKLNRFKQLTVKGKESHMAESQSTLSINELSSDIREAIAELKSRPEIESVGVVTRVGDGIAWIYGLASAGYNEMLDIDGTDGQKVTAFALSLGEDEIGAVLLGDDTLVKAGAKVRLSGKILEVPVGPELVGRIVDPLGNPIDGGPAIKTKQTSHVERAAPGVLARKSVFEPLMTGLIAIDAIVPIGRGQRELIIGDRQTGKTAIAIDTMVNQYRQKTGVINVYVAIGQKTSKVAALQERLKREGVMDQTIIVATSPADPAAMLRILPR
jgi:hypothetical protein